MNFTRLLADSALKSKSFACLGMDPVLEKIPVRQQNVRKKIVRFYSEILDAVHAEIGAVKPNYAFFAQYGFDGLKALQQLILAARKKELPVILDAKRGDIGKSSEAYAREAFDFWNADAVTVSPYMGSDSVKPFIDYCRKGKGVYLLVRTSNPGAADFQQLMSDDGQEFFMKTAARLIDWHVEGLGAVVGATNISELGKLASFFASSGRQVPLLIPGVGSQGGSAAQVSSVLKDKAIHRVNSSSSLCYAYEQSGESDFAKAALQAVRKLNSELGKVK